MTQTATESHLADRHAAFMARVQAIVDDLVLPENFRIVFEQEPGGQPYLQIACLRPDTFTGEMGEGRGRPARLTENVTRSEVVFTVWGLFESYVIHEAREAFLYRGRRVLGPHMDIDAIWSVADQLDAGQQVDLNPAAAAAAVEEKPVSPYADLIRRAERRAAELREAAKGHREALALKGDNTGGSAWMLDDQADAHESAARALATEIDVKAALRRRIDWLRAEAENMEAESGDEHYESGPGHRRALADIYVGVLNEVLALADAGASA